MEPIVVETRITYDDLNKFLWSHEFRRPTLWIALVFFVFAVLYLLFFIIMIGPQNLSLTMWFAIALVPMMITLFFFRIPLYARKMRKTSKIHFESTVRMTFLPDELTIESIGPSLKSSSSYRYDAFYKVVETSDFLYLYISSHQAHLVPKRDIAPGMEIALINFLKEKAGKKFSSHY